jgi:hypothetical protein
MNDRSEGSNQGATISTSRLESFSDGVFAIAATLLILNVHAGTRSLGPSLLHSWPSFAAYAVSFVTIAIIWINHHTVFAQIGQVDRPFLFINILFLMFVAFIPFPAVFFNALWFYAAAGHRLLRPDADPRIVSGISRSYLPGPFIYLAATLIAFANALASVVLFALIAVFYVIESSFFGRANG